jgi:aspartyl-tRNA(Asn)/glutamyl-tRNA(Gln) amidotransferase subunit A
MEINNLTIRQIREAIKNKKISREEIVGFFVNRINQVEGKLNSFVSVFGEEAVKEAARQDVSECGEGLSGIPMGIKDLFCTKDQRTTAASRMLADFVPPYDAEIVKKLKSNGGIIIGKNNCDAWAHGASNETSFFGPVCNPWDLIRVPGGSSGGSQRQLRPENVFSLSGRIRAAPFVSQPDSAVSWASSQLMEEYLDMV